MTSANTLQQRFGFVDEDRKNPKHEEIMLWLDMEVENLILDFYGRDWNYEGEQKKFFEYKSSYPEGAPDEMPLLPPKLPIILKEMVWEKPLEAENDDPVGFIDLYVRHTVSWVSPYRLLHHGWGWHLIEEDHTSCFVVKSFIHSIDEVIRQVQMYKSYEISDFWVVCPDDRFVDLLNEQGIGFIKYPY
jgi:hypothetical protein